MLDMAISNDWGIFLLTVKPGDAQKAIKRVQRLGREKDIIHITKNGAHRFDPIAYEAARGGDVNSIVAILRAMQSVGKPQSHGDGASEFFKDSAEQWEAAAVALLIAANEVSLINIRNIINSAPEMPIPEDPALHTPEMLDWFANSYTGKILTKVADRHAAGEVSDEEWRAAEQGVYFIASEVPRLAAATMTSIKQTFSSLCSKIMMPPYDHLMSNGCTWVPDQLFLEGKIIIVDVPTSETESAVLLQVAYKRSVQMAIARRDVDVDPRPVMIHVDEFQVTCHSDDASALEILREARGISCYLTQSLTNISRRFREHQLGTSTFSITNNMMCRVALANTDHPTNSWWSDVLGKEHVQLVEGGLQSAHTRSDYRFVLEPRAFSALPIPTPNFRAAVGVCYRGGQPLDASGKPFVIHAFQQV
jgi:hypothetical protein